jgi:hypothetical protein
LAGVVFERLNGNIVGHFPSQDTPAPRSLYKYPILLISVSPVSETLSSNSSAFIRIIFTMDLFSPCNRLYDILESQGRLPEFRGRRWLFREPYLNVPSEEFLSAERSFTYPDLHAMLGNGETVA